MASATVFDDLKLYENTYRTKPMDGKKFRIEPVKEIISAVLDAKLDKRKYNPKEAPTLIKEICNEIQNQVKVLGFDRYKVIVQVTLSEIIGQGCYIGSRGMWDHETDNYATGTFRNGSFFCVAMVFGCYTP